MQKYSFRTNKVQSFFLLYMDVIHPRTGSPHNQNNYGLDSGGSSREEDVSSVSWAVMLCT